VTTLFSSLGTWFIAFIAMFSSLAQGTKWHKKTSLKMHPIKFVGGYLEYSPLHYGTRFCQKNLFLIASRRIFNRQNPKKIKELTTRFVQIIFYHDIFVGYG